MCRSLRQYAHLVCHAFQFPDKIFGNTAPFNSPDNAIDNLMVHFSQHGFAPVLCRRRHFLRGLIGLLWHDAYRKRYDSVRLIHQRHWLHITHDKIRFLWPNSLADPYILSKNIGYNKMYIYNKLHTWSMSSEFARSKIGRCGSVALILRRW